MSTASITDTYAVEHDYANTLRQVADAIDDGDLPLPTSNVRVYLTRYGTDGKSAFLTARRLFPEATVKIDDEKYGYVELIINPHASLLFDKNALGEQQTVTREVVEYVLAPELLAAVPA